MGMLGAQQILALLEMSAWHKFLKPLASHPLVQNTKYVDHQLAQTLLESNYHMHREQQRLEELEHSCHLLGMKNVDHEWREKLMISGVRSEKAVGDWKSDILEEQEELIRKGFQQLGAKVSRKNFLWKEDYFAKEHFPVRVKVILVSGSATEEEEYR